MDLREIIPSQKPSLLFTKTEYNYGFNMTILEVMVSLLQNTETRGIFKERVCDFRYYKVVQI